jgi:A/G-specific adenine glycosylase
MTPDRRGRKQPDAANISSFQQKLLRWYRKHGRRFPWRSRSAGTYEVVVSEILLQRTRAEVAARFLPGFVRRYPSWQSLRDADQDDLEAMLRPIGLWRRRAMSLKNLASALATTRNRFPRERSELQALPAVGQYVANAVLLFSHGEAQPLLDSTMARVLERHFGKRDLADIRYDPYLQVLAVRAVTCSEAAAMNWAILDLGASICTAKAPRCDICPVRASCVAFATSGGRVT